MRALRGPYRRFIQMFGDVVLGVEHDNFEETIDTQKMMRGAALDTDLDAEDWKVIAIGFKERIEDETGNPFPQDPRDQLWGAITAVFGSWRTTAPTRIAAPQYSRKLGDCGQRAGHMFGNMGDDRPPALLCPRSGKGATRSMASISLTPRERT